MGRTETTEQKRLQRTCPSCGCLVGQCFGSLQYALYDDCPLSRQVEVVSCQRCALVFYDTASSAGDYAAYYGSFLYYATGDIPGSGGLSEDERRRYRETATILFRHGPSGKHPVLDVGCAKGGLLDTLHDLGCRNVAGIDLLPRNVASVNQRIDGEPARLGSVENIPFPDGTMGAVVVSHVLEHVYSIAEAIAEIRRVLIGGGLLFVEVPNAAHYPTYDEARPWDLLYEHINHFDVGQLASVFCPCGFELLERGTKMMATGCAGGHCLYALFRKTGARTSPASDRTLGPVLRGCLRPNPRTLETIERLASRRTPLYVWGLSSYMLHMLAQSPLSRCQIEGLLDGNAFKQTKTIDGIVVTSPAVLEHGAGPDAVVVPTGPYSQEMVSRLECSDFAGEVVVV